ACTSGIDRDSGGGIGSENPLVYRITPSTADKRKAPHQRGSGVDPDIFKQESVPKEATTHKAND
ncbi:MAG: hypothetical protein C0506_17350, partial [Anaerolinea sp.]|nr:hypothetical protein [Anaerolinea sp.]